MFRGVGSMGRFPSIPPSIWVRIPPSGRGAVGSPCPSRMKVGCDAAGPSAAGSGLSALELLAAGVVHRVGFRRMTKLDAPAPPTHCDDEDGPPGGGSSYSPAPASTGCERAGLGNASFCGKTHSTGG